MLNKELHECSFKLFNKLDLLNLTIATAESCTGGLIAEHITKHPGSSRIFTAGLITYSNESKIKLLNIDNKIISTFGAVSKEVAIAMVTNLTRICTVDIGIAVTGIAGPDGSSNNKPLGLVHHAISIKNKIIHVKKIYKGDRNKVRNKAAKECFYIILQNI